MTCKLARCDGEGYLDSTKPVTSGFAEVGAEMNAIPIAPARETTDYPGRAR